MISLPNWLALKIAAVGVCILLLALLVHDRGRWKAKTAHYAELLAAERAAHAATEGNYRAAADKARLADQLNAARARAEQDRINERTKDEFESRIAAARAAAGGLRRQPETAAADTRPGGNASLPGLSATAQGAAEAAGQDELSPAERLTATEQAIQLDELIKWVMSQAAVQQSND